jgi:surface polysaccharide O-acyltransferase-like enzyme
VGHFKRDASWHVSLRQQGQDTGRGCAYYTVKKIITVVVAQFPILLNRNTPQSVSSPRLTCSHLNFLAAYHCHPFTLHIQSLRTFNCFVDEHLCSSTAMSLFFPRLVVGIIDIQINCSSPLSGTVPGTTGPGPRNGALLSYPCC